MRKLKPFVIVLCALALVSVAVLGTLAFLQDSEDVVNVFTVGQVKLALDEAVVTPDGVPVGDLDGDGNQDRTSDRSIYHLIPGKKYTKDPTVTVLAGSEEAYVRMLVTVNCYDELCDIFGDPFLPQYCVEGWDGTKWVSTTVIDTDDTANTATYEFRYFETVDAPDGADVVLPALFTKLVVDGSLTNEDLASISNLQITIEAHAIQATGFADADAAWTAFSK